MRQEITWENCRVKLGDLQKWAQNPRFSTKAQAQRILKSLDDFGQVQTIAIDPDGGVLDGHQRLSALLTIHGNDYEIDARRASRKLTDAERRGLVVALHAGATGAWDWDNLSGWDAGELQAWGMDADYLKALNNDANNLKELLAADEGGEADAEPQIDRAEELREKWKTERGQLWAIGEHKLLCGDSTSADDVARVMGGERAGACVTDPPYGLGDSKSFNDDHPDYDDEHPFYLKLIDLSMPFVVWGGNYYSDLPIDRNKIGWVVWDKRPDLEGEKRERADRIFGQHFEIAITTIGDLRGKILRHRWGGFYGSEKIYHKTQKSLSLILECVSKTNGVVVDYFAGSGTTLVACQNLNRKCRAIEISPAYCAVILERMITAFPDIDIHLIDG